MAHHHKPTNILLLPPINITRHHLLTQKLPAASFRPDESIDPTGGENTPPVVAPLITTPNRRILYCKCKTVHPYHSPRTDTDCKPQDIGETETVNHNIWCFAGWIATYYTVQRIACPLLSSVIAHNGPRTSDNQFRRVLYRPK